MYGIKKNMSKQKTSQTPTVRTMVLKEDGEEYAVVTKVLGNCRYKVKLNMSEKEVVGRLPGRMRKHKKECWVELNSVVLVSLRDFQEEIVDILHVYTDAEVRKLKKEKEYFEEDQKDAEIIKEEDTPFDFDEI